ncbi:hypothetical protein BC830DRAFT_1078368 [Chytriomyces sp. MP71]|nr:hypothetical protein BC830DRAFT_1078368 [Chytriomyces sp. MP71]
MRRLRLLASVLLIQYLSSSITRVGKVQERACELCDVPEVLQQRAFTFLESEEQKVAKNLGEGVYATMIAKKDNIAVMKHNRKILFQDMAEKCQKVQNSIVIQDMRSNIVVNVTSETWMVIFKQQIQQNQLIEANSSLFQTNATHMEAQARQLQANAKHSDAVLQTQAVAALTAMISTRPGAPMHLRIKVIFQLLIGSKSGSESSCQFQGPCLADNKFIAKLSLSQTTMHVVKDIAERENMGVVGSATWLQQVMNEFVAVNKRRGLDSFSETLK